MPAPGSIALPSSPTHWAIRSSKHADKDQAMTESLDTIDVVVKRITHEATGIASFELRPAEGGTLPPFTAGAPLDLRLGTGLVGSYCGSTELLGGQGWVSTRGSRWWELH